MYRKTLVLGASLKKERYSNIAIQRLRAKNISVVALGAREGVVGDVSVDVGRKIYKDIDTITLYLNPKRQSEYYDYIVSLNPNRVIFNPGTENLELINLLKQKEIFPEVACTLVLLSINQY
tara:strand:- start:22534 stop:22896 length:363 start_codon:yes stop_codon:yes gene_type:complete